MRKSIMKFNATGIFVFLLMLFLAAGIAEEERTDAAGQWKYALEGGGATIRGCVEKPSGDFVIPSEIEGYPVIGIGERALNGLSITSVTLPDSVKRIGDFAFSGCDWLPEITIPASVIRIGANPFARSGLKNIRVASANPVYKDIKGVLFDKEKNLLISYPNDKTGKYAIPKGTMGIGESAFEWSPSLTGVTIPGSVTGIGDQAFYMCQSLAAVTISKGVTQIGDSAFYDCRMLTKVTIPGSVTSIGDSAFFGCERLKTVTLEKGVAEIGDSAYQHCDALTKVTIPDGVTSIGDSAFFGCWALKGASVPASVAYIGEGAFDCSEEFTLAVKQGSYAEQYAQENDIPYVFATK